MLPTRNIAAALLLICIACLPRAANAWADEGHEVIALIADHYLQPRVRRAVADILNDDDSHLTATDIASESTWADKYRDSDRDSSKQRYLATRQWHFVNIQLGDNNLAAACFRRPMLPPGVPASQGPAQDCVVDKIEQFAIELKARDTQATERVRALQFLLHFVGDVHQPLHASDADDHGGNDRIVVAQGLPKASLHHYWDSEFVKRLGVAPTAVAAQLINAIAAEDLQRWSVGTAADWAEEAYQLAVTRVYPSLGEPDDTGTYTLTAQYMELATRTTAVQLCRAGVRLAYLLNQTLR